MSREDKIKSQLNELGIYSPAFDSAIHELCILERELSRARKQWKETAPPGGKPSMTSPAYSVVIQIRREVLAYQNALGLTPSGLKRLKGKELSKEKTKGDEITERLDKIREAVERYG